MSNFQKVEGVGEASVFRGDNRLKQSDIDAWYQEVLRETGGPSKRPYLYGSDAGLCARRNVLLEHNTWIPGSKSPATAAYMAIGVGLEDMLAAALQRNNRLLAQGQRLIDMPEVKVSGKMDLLVFDHDDKLAIIEVKTCGQLPTEAKPVHLAQIQTYSAISGIHRCWLTYISRNVRSNFTEKLEMRTFSVDTSEDVLKQRLHIALVSRIASDKRQLPPVPATFRKHTECHYCEFRDHFCWGARPGLGGDAADPPLVELSTKAMIDIDMAIQPTVQYLYDNSLERRLKTLKSLNVISLPISLYERFIKEKEMLTKELLV